MINKFLMLVFRILSVVVNALVNVQNNIAYMDRFICKDCSGGIDFNNICETCGGTGSTLHKIFINFE